ncbi:MAG: hemerythrin domain-containing protein [Methanomassiliicoccales archaeon]
MRVAITLLQYEHGVIRQVLDCLGKAAREDGKHISLFPDISTFLTEYMDEFHHGKEERFLFPFMRDFDLMPDAVDDLLEDHRKARELIGAMGECIEGDEVTDPREYMARARELVEHVTLHVQVEENSVFPRIEESISIEQDQKLYEKYDHFTTRGFGPDFQKKNEDFSFYLQDKIMGPGRIEGIF